MTPPRRRRFPRAALVALLLCAFAAPAFAQGDLAGACYRTVGAHMVFVDRGADHFGVFEGMGVFLAAAR